MNVTHAIDCGVLNNPLSFPCTCGANVMHTPGPWRLNDAIHAHVLDDTYHCIDAGCGFHMLPSDKGFGIAGRMALADARLITAAPDLLALAHQYASECSECGGTGLVTKSYGGDGYGDRCAALADADDQPCPDCADIRAVIAKASA